MSVLAGPSHPEPDTTTGQPAPCFGWLFARRGVTLTRYSNPPIFNIEPDMKPSSAAVNSVQPSLRPLSVEVSVLLLLVLVGFAARFVLMDWPNFKPVAAFAIFAGFYFQRTSLAAIAIVAMLLLSDIFIGSYPLPIMISVYACMAVGIGLGVSVATQCRRNDGTTRGVGAIATRNARVTMSALGMSCLFFLVTNFAVWASGQWYPVSLSGLSTCYVNAVPFFRFTVAGDLFFSAAAFVAYDAVRWMAVNRGAKPLATAAG